jgi:hypothetical protein
MNVNGFQIEKTAIVSSDAMVNVLPSWGISESTQNMCSHSLLVYAEVRRRIPV